MSLPSQILNVLPGGKYHEQAQAVQIFLDTELQYRRTDNVESGWINALAEDYDVFSDLSFEDGYPLEWRIKPKPKMQRYRVAKCNLDGLVYPVICTDAMTISTIKGFENFVEWLDDWIEYEA